MTQSTPSGENLFSILSKLKTKEGEFFAAIQSYLDSTDLGGPPEVGADAVIRFRLMFRQIEVIAYHLQFSAGVGARMDFYERHPITHEANLLLTAYLDTLGNVRTDNRNLAMSANNADDVARFVEMLTNALLNVATDETT